MPEPKNEAKQPYSSVPQQEEHEGASDNQPFEEFDIESVYEGDRDDEDQVEELGTSSMKMAFMNMANSILGAGIIGQAFAFKNCGLIGGIVVMIFLAVLIDWTLRLIVVNAELSKTRSYQDTVNYCYGRNGKLLLLFSISLFAVGGCMAFAVIIGDTIPHVLKAFIPKSVTEDKTFGWIFSRNAIITIFLSCISYPLSLNRDISKLAKASGFALVGMLIIIILTMIRAPLVSSDLKAPLTKPEWTVNYNIFQGISVISFALVCHHNTIFIYNSMRNATVKKFAKLTHIACIISMICCSVIAINGLLNFGDKTKGNLLNNFRSDDKLINVARFCFGLNMLTTFPLEVFVVRDVIKDLMLSSGLANGSTAHLELGTKQHIIITSILVFVPMIVALFTCNLGMILELIGATSASLMAYIIPPFCYIKLSWDDADYRNMNKSNKRHFIMFKIVPSICCIIFGFTVMFISSFMTIRASINNPDSGHCVED